MSALEQSSSSGGIHSISDPEIEDANPGSKSLPDRLIRRFVPQFLMNHLYNITNDQRSPKGGVFLTLHYDQRFLNSCMSYKQLTIIVTTFIIIIISSLVGGCFKSDESLVDIPESSVVSTVVSPVTYNSTAVSTLVSISASTFPPEEYETRLNFAQCTPLYFFFLIGILTEMIQTILYISYLFHIVEALPHIPWLPYECLFYTIWSVLYFIATILVSLFGGWMVLASLLGFIDSICFVCLAGFKYAKFQSGEPAQPISDHLGINEHRIAAKNTKFVRETTDVAMEFHTKSRGKR